MNISLWILTNIHRVNLDGGWWGTINLVSSHPVQRWVIPVLCGLQKWLPPSWLTPAIPLWSQSASPASFWGWESSVESPTHIFLCATFSSSMQVPLYFSYTLGSYKKLSINCRSICLDTLAILSWHYLSWTQEKCPLLCGLQNYVGWLSPFSPPGPGFFGTTSTHSCFLLNISACVKESGQLVWR